MAYVQCNGLYIGHFNEILMCDTTDQVMETYARIYTSQWGANHKAAALRAWGDFVGRTAVILQMTIWHF